MTDPASLRLETPCKINLHLRIQDRRPDGYHDLETIFALLDWGDALEFALLPGSGGLTSVQWDLDPYCAAFAGELAALPPEKNLVYRASALFREHTGFDRNLRITVKKRVPPGSGLGGGSSNAAFTLYGLNTLAGELCSIEVLRELAARLGSDTPFFLCGAGAAWGRGRGEVLEPFFPPLSRFGVIVVIPPFQSSTVKAYALLDKRRENSRRETSRRENSRKDELQTPAQAVLLEAFEKNPDQWPFSNDFVAVLDEGTPYCAIFRALQETGAAFTGLSGSGSACFGIYGSREDAARAQKNLRAAFINKEYFIQNTFFLRSIALGSRMIIDKGSV